MRMKYQRLIKQYIYFFITGIAATSFDYLVYILTLELTGAIIAKIFGFYSGACLSFPINSSVTFSKKGKSFLFKTYFVKYIFLLTINMMVNVTINYLILRSFYHFENITIFAFIFATFVSMVFNFFGMKFLVFK